MFVVFKADCPRCGREVLRTVRWEDGNPVPVLGYCDSCRKQEQERRDTYYKWNLKGDKYGVGSAVKTG